jgi:ubiquinone/menaquinone biosynthesis C-methylase UbiE
MKQLLLVPLFLSALLWPLKGNAQRTDKQMANCTFLYSKPEMVRAKLVAFFDTLHFTPGERIAEVGASGANLAGMFSIAYKDIDFTLEDIDSTCLNDQQTAFVLRYYAGINGGKQPEGIRCHVVIGNDSSTTLPDAAYQKVFFINTYHEVTKPRQMLADIHRILAPDGTLYMQEQVSDKMNMRRHDCGHLMPNEQQLLQAMTDAGFRLAKVNIMDRKWRITGHSKSCWYQFRKA